MDNNLRKLDILEEVARAIRLNAGVDDVFDVPLAESRASFGLRSQESEAYALTHTMETGIWGAPRALSCIGGCRSRKGS